MKHDGPIRVLLVQHSPGFRTLLAGALRKFQDIEVADEVGSASGLSSDLLRGHPDLILLDLTLPDSVAERLLADLREHYPAPIIGCASAGRGSAARALAAIERGVADVVVKPRGCDGETLQAFGDEIARKIRAAAAKARPVYPRRPPVVGGCEFTFRGLGIDPRRYLVVVGASTGGPEALREFLAAMPADSPGIAIVQHMPAYFTPAFSKRLDERSSLHVSQAVDGDTLVPGRAVVARGDTHLTVRRRGAEWRAIYTNQRKVNRHCPSVDVLFDSAVEAAGDRTIGVLLTGMGADGAAGLLRLRQCGALTLGQDSRSSVVFGMPKVAQELGAVEIVGSPEELPEMMLRALVARKRQPALR